MTWTPVDMFSVDTALYPHDTNRTAELVRTLAWAAQQYAYLYRTGFAMDKHTAVSIEQVDTAVAQAIKRYGAIVPKRTAYLGRI